MRKVALVLLGVFFVLAIAGAAFAAEKLGYVDLSRAFSEYKKTKDYDKVLGDKESSYTSERDKKVDEVKKFQDKLNLLGDKEKKAKEAEMEAKVKALQEFDRQKQTDLRKDQDEKMKEISNAVKDGATAYLYRQYKTLVPFVVVIALILGFAFNFLTSMAFVFGAILSALAGYAGMQISVRTNAKVAEKSKKGLKEGLKLAFKGGSVTGFIVVAMGLLGAGNGIIFPSVMAALTSTCRSDETPRVLLAYTLSWNVGLMVGVPAAGWLFDATNGRYWAFGSALVASVTLMILARALGNARRVESTVEVTHESGGGLPPMAFAVLGINCINSLAKLS